MQATDGPQGKRAIRLTRASAAEVEAFNQRKKQVRRQHLPVCLVSGLI